MLPFPLSTLNTRKWAQNQLTQVWARWLASFPFLPDKSIISLPCRTKAQSLHVSFRRERNGRGTRDAPEKKRRIKLNGACSAGYYFPGKEFWKREEGKVCTIAQERSSLISWFSLVLDCCKARPIKKWVAIAEQTHLCRVARSFNYTPYNSFRYTGIMCIAEDYSAPGLL